MKTGEQEKIDSGEIVVDLNFLKNEILDASPDLIRILIKAARYGKGKFGNSGELTDEDKEKGRQLVPLEKRIETAKWLLDKIWKDGDKGGSDAEKTHEEFMEDINLDVESEITQS
jgi:hypothetical protein